MALLAFKNVLCFDAFDNMPSIVLELYCLCLLSLDDWMCYESNIYVLFGYSSGPL